MLQEFSNKYQRKMWLSMISRLKLNIDPFELLEFNNETVYYMPYNGFHKFEVNTTNCLHCGSKLALGFRKNNFIVDTCKCVKDKTNRFVTTYKLQSLFSKKQSLKVIEVLSKHKTRKLKNIKENWIRDGFSEDEATIKVATVQRNRSRKSPASKKGATDYTCRRPEFWILRGFTEEESKQKVSEYQVSNGLNWYIKKYGKDEGSKKYNKRISQWLKKMSKLNLGVSQVSVSLFEQVDPSNNGKYGSNETTVRGKEKVYRVDYLDKKQRKIIEFDGDYWHANPSKFAPTDVVRNKTAKEIWEVDQRKTQDLVSAGYKVLRVTEQEFVDNPKETIQKCKDFLNED